jgi:hypothetical protein
MRLDPSVFESCYPAVLNRKTLSFDPTIGTGSSMSGICPATILARSLSSVIALLRAHGSPKSWSSSPIAI